MNLQEYSIFKEVVTNYYFDKFHEVIVHRHSDMNVTKEDIKNAIDLGFDVDAQDKNGCTLCLHAALFCKTGTLLELVRLGADISIKSKARRTLFDCIDDDETKEEVIRLRKEYEENHPDATKMADELAKKYLPEVAAKLVDTSKNGRKAREKGVKAANNQGRQKP